MSRTVARSGWVLLLALPLLAQEPTLPDQPGARLPLAPDDWRLELKAEREFRFVAPAGRRAVLHFLARIDNPTTVGSTNMVRVEVNGAVVGYRTPRRQVRLLNKPNRFAWSDPPTLSWFLRQGEWRLAYAPNFDILAKLPYYGPEAYRFDLDLSDLVQPGENRLRLLHTGNEDIAKHAGSDLAVVFRELSLEVREGPCLLPGEPAVYPRDAPFTVGAPRATPIALTARADQPSALVVKGARYEVESVFVTAGEKERQPRRLGLADGRVEAGAWSLERRIETSREGRVIVRDTFHNLTNQAVAIKIDHRLRSLGRQERVYLAGMDDPSLDEVSQGASPYLFCPAADHGVGLAAWDDVLRVHGVLSFDDVHQVGSLRDDCFGLPPGGRYQMTWAVYATASPNRFDLVNLLRADWFKPFRLEGGINFFEADAILAYDEQALAEHLARLNINVAMSQGGWVDRKLAVAGRKNVGHGPIVLSDLYADYRRRLREATAKLKRVRPGLKVLIYYDPRLVSGDGLLERYADSLPRDAGGRPRGYVAETAFGMSIAVVCPTLENGLGKEILARIPTMILDELGADGMYWDEMAWGFDGIVDYAHPDGYTHVTDPVTGAVRAGGAPELVVLPFKQALLQAFAGRGAMVNGNCAPATLSEYAFPMVRFSETKIPRRPYTARNTQLFSPVSYAGYSVYRKPGVTEQDFLDDIRDKLWDANLYLFSSHLFYSLFTHENLATYQYPITPVELDAGVIVGRERILTLRSGRFGWPGESWTGKLLRFDAEQRLAGQESIHPEADGLLSLKVPENGALVLVRDQP